MEAVPGTDSRAARPRVVTVTVAVAVVHSPTAAGDPNGQLPTDTSLVERPSSTGREAALLPILMDTFGINEAAARVLSIARRPMTARRSQQQRDFAQRYASAGQARDRRSTLEDGLFPLEHLTLEHLTIEPLDLAA